ncbi:MAG: nucleoside hydrolase, partial [Anaerolineae bacterium]|nr:nucleoside hydrolase [Anaerolineae bacterium]
VQVRATSEGLEQIRAAGTPFHKAVAEQVERYPRFQGQGWTNLHDPLAAASVIRPHLVEFTPLHLDVELDGTFAAGATLMRTAISTAKANVRVALRVNVAEFEEFFVGRAAQ